MTISLAFLAPDLVKAAIDGRLPHGFGVTRLSDLPAEWSRQRRILGLGAYWSAFEPRLRNAVRRRPETKAQKWPRQSNVVSPETETNQRAPLIAGISAQGGNSPVARDCVVELGRTRTNHQSVMECGRVRPAHPVEHHALELEEPLLTGKKGESPVAKTDGPKRMRGKTARQGR